MTRTILAAFAIGAALLIPSLSFAQEGPPTADTHSLTATLSPNFSWSLNGDDQPRHVDDPENVKTTDDPDLDGRIDYRFEKYTLYASKLSLPLSLGSIIVHTPHASFAVYPGDGVDFLYQAGIQRQFSRHLAVGLEYRYRYRVCCAGDSDPSNTQPSGYGGPALNVNLSYGPYTPLKLVFGYNTELQAVLDRNHPDPGLVLGPGIPYHGDQLVLVHDAISVASLWNRSITPFFVYDHSADDYRSQAGPSYAHFFLYGVGHNFSRMADIKMFFINLHQIRNSGLNTAGADTIHFSVFSIVADFKFDLLHLEGRH
jgi:hypothetical protein